MSNQTKERKAVSVFDDIFRNASRELYIIEGSGRLKNSRHKFTDMRWSPSANEKRKATYKQIRDEFPSIAAAGITAPSWTMLLNEEDYEQGVYAIMDDDGLVATKNKELAKLAYREYKSMDPEVKIHPHSLKFDPDEPVDEKMVTRLSLDHDPWEEAQTKAKGAKKS